MKARIAVIGAGWAGLACAHYLKQANYGVTVFESSRYHGGRAKPIMSDYDSEAPLATGQHILVGAYEHTIRLMHDLGIASEKVFYKQKLSLNSVSGDFKLSTIKAPVPMRNAFSLLLSSGLKPAEKLQIITTLRHFKKNNWSTYSSFTVSKLLGYQADNIKQKFWEPLCFLALNLPIEEACANLFLRFLKTIFDQPRKRAQILIPRVALNDLWPNKAIRQIETRFNHTVKRLNNYQNCVFVDKEKFDGVVLCCSPINSARLLEPIHPKQELPWNEFDFSYSSIATASFKFAGPLRLSKPMLMMNENRRQEHYGQWVFDRQALFNLPPNHGDINIVCNHPKDLEELSGEVCLSRVLAQFKEEYEHSGKYHLPDVIDSEWNFEKRATFHAKPGIIRPNNATPWPRIFIAGDWTNTGHPGLLESAVMSGYLAAKSVQERFKVLKNK